MPSDTRLLWRFPIDNSDGASFFYDTEDELRFGLNNTTTFYGNRGLLIDSNGENAESHDEEKLLLHNPGRYTLYFECRKTVYNSAARNVFFYGFSGDFLFQYNKTTIKSLFKLGNFMWESVEHNTNCPWMANPQKTNKVALQWDTDTKECKLCWCDITLDGWQGINRPLTMTSGILEDFIPPDPHSSFYIGLIQNFEGWIRELQLWEGWLVA